MVTKAIEIRLIVITLSPAVDEYRKVGDTKNREQRIVEHSHIFSHGTRCAAAVPPQDLASSKAVVKSRESRVRFADDKVRIFGV